MIFQPNRDCRPAPRVLEPDIKRPRRDETAARHLETGRSRLLVTAGLFTVAFAALGVRLIDVTLLTDNTEPKMARSATVEIPRQRAQIVDRNGVILATSLRTYSLYAHPWQVIDAKAAATKLKAALPSLDQPSLAAMFATKKRFAWVKRHLTPAQYQKVNSLGLPGLYVRPDERRVYPHGRMAAHVIGFTNVDNRGLSGVEQYFDAELERGMAPLRLTLDIRVQYALRDEIGRAMKRFRAQAGTAVVMDAHNGNIIGMASLPDFDPNHPAEAPVGSRFNRGTLGVYELGSIFKLLTVAQALDSGTARMQDRVDVRRPIRIASYSIRDYQMMHRLISVDEVIVYSSNIGAAKLALGFGGKAQKRFLGKLGLLTPVKIELPEVGAPLFPKKWRKINTMTIAFGHGVAVSPVQFSAAMSAIVNGGLQVRPTLVKRPGRTIPVGKRLLSEETSLRVRYLMRQVVKRGTGKRAASPGYLVGGKTGSADKYSNGKRPRGLISSFVGAFPINNPRYVVLIVLDDPKGNKETGFKGTGGLVAAPTFKEIVGRIAPILKVSPVNEAEYDQRWTPQMVNSGVRRLASFGASGRNR